MSEFAGHLDKWREFVLGDDESKALAYLATTWREQGSTREEFVVSFGHLGDAGAAWDAEVPLPDTVPTAPERGRLVPKAEQLTDPGPIPRTMGEACECTHDLIAHEVVQGEVEPAVSCAGDPDTGEPCAQNCTEFRPVEAAQ